MPIVLMSTVGLAALMAPLASTAHAQVQAPDEHAVPTVVVQDSGAPASHAYRLGSGVDSGVSRFDRSSVEARAPGSGDVNEVLKAMPTVQFTSNQGVASRAELQDLRPENISISGGAINENLFVLDGVGVNSRLDTSNTNAAAFDEVANASAQTVWMDSSLIGAVRVHDSNVSAEFGQFTGGVVEIDTRSPGRRYGGDVYYSFTNADMARYRLSSLAKNSGATIPGTPEFDKSRYGFSLDLPIGERLRTLLAYNRSEATVTNYPGTNYVSLGDLNQRSLSQNLMVKAEYDLASDLMFTGQVTYSPYESEFYPANSRDNLLTSNGGGLTTRFGLEGARGAANWSLDLTHAWSDTDRDGPAGTYVVPTSAPGFEGCSISTNCTFGSVGPLTQNQKDTGLKFKWEQPLGSGQLRAGADYIHIEAQKVRAETILSHLGGVVSPNTACALNEGLSCVPGAYAAARRLAYGAFDASASIDAYGLWAEYNVDVAGFMVRAGARYDYESFLGNHDIAPRLSVSRDLPWAGINLTLGVNRYYGRSFLGYALREGQGVTRGYSRTAQNVDGQSLWSDNWVLTSHSDPSRYSDMGLSTPYADEFALAMSGPMAWIGGEYRIKSILRDSKDQFASTVGEVSYYDNETGATARRTTRTITNDGSRKYQGLSLEYVRDFGRNHALSLSTNFSKTEASNLTYFDVAESIDYEGDLVVYQGQIVTKLAAISDNQLEDYANPFFINADWSARWMQGRLRTNVNARWRDGFERVEDTGVNERIDGVSYDVFDRVSYGDAVDVNLSATYDLVRTSYGTAQLDVRLNNLFNTVANENYSSTTQPWQLGRNAWVGVKYRY